MLSDLIAELVAIDSVNPDVVPGGAGEREMAAFVARWLKRGGFEVTIEGTACGRPNVIGSRRGGGDASSGPTLLLLAHTDTVGVAGVEQPFAPRIEDGRLYGRGAYDMKAGLAAAMAAAAAVEPAAGEIVVAAVCDEECGSAGTRALLASGRRFDAAIVTEPTELAVAVAHKGFVGFEIETKGRAAHGSRPDLGVDAILAMAPVMEQLRDLDQRLQSGRAHALLGTGSLHASLIEGGQEFSSYPARCLLTGEMRTLPGDDPEALLRATASDAELRVTHRGEPFETAPDAEIVSLVHRHAGTELTGLPFWADSALTASAGIPTVLFGPAGEGAHAAVEWVEVASAERVRDVLIAVAREFCG